MVMQSTTRVSRTSGAAILTGSVSDFAIFTVRTSGFSMLTGTVADFSIATGRVGDSSILTPMVLAGAIFTLSGRATSGRLAANQRDIDILNLLLQLF